MLDVMCFVGVFDQKALNLSSVVLVFFLLREISEQCYSEQATCKLKLEQNDSAELQKYWGKALVAFFTF